MTARRIAQYEPPRDSYGRPKIGGRTYQRASTRAKMLDDKSGLIDWKGRQVFDAVRARPELLELDAREAIALIEGDKGSASGYGRAVHSVIEARAYGDPDPDGATEEQLSDAKAARVLLEELGLEIVTCELFVVDQGLGVAGSLDYLLRDAEGAAYIGDTKTVGRPDAWGFNGLSWAMQLAIYARALPVDEAGEIVTWESLGLPVPSLEEGLIVQIHAKNAQATPVRVDLDAGYIAAGVAGDIRAIRRHCASLIE